MDPPTQPQHYTVDLLTDPACAKDTIKGILHSIFFHRTFTPIRPMTRDILETTLMVVEDPDLETLIDSKATAAVRKLEAASNSSALASTTHPVLVVKVEFSEKRRRNKAYFTFSFTTQAEEEFVWESWALRVQMQRARTEGEAQRLRSKMEASLRAAAFKVVDLAGGEKDHIPPITTTDTNPFPYRIVVGEVG